MERLAWYLCVLAAALGMIVIGVRLGKAYEVEESYGLVCNTAEQVEAFAAFKGDDATALQWVNAQTPHACAIMPVRFVRGDEVKHIAYRDVQGTVARIAVVGVRTEHGWQTAQQPLVQYTLFTDLLIPVHDGEHADWYKRQMINPEALPRLNVPFKSCCDSGDHFRTRFRLLQDGTKYGTETYEYWKDGEWRVVPPDIIKRAKTPDGRPVLFIHRQTGKELCFIIDEEGI